MKRTEPVTVPAVVGLNPMVMAQLAAPARELPHVFETMLKELELVPLKAMEVIVIVPLPVFLSVIA